MKLTNILEIPAGKIQGIQQKTKSGTDYQAYYGIPYAEPPVDKLRFCRPNRLSPWSGVLKAINKNIKAIQNERGRIVGQEDCLCLNIYIPGTKRNAILPVMVFIHGGGFQIGDGGPQFYGPDYFMDEGIILVTINYRLGILGFLTLRSDYAPGNLGLWDQKMALEWVKDNIGEFDGDSNNVTIFGESAGSISCMMQLVSPQSEGLFHKLIAQSGTFVNGYDSSSGKANSGHILAGQIGLDVSNKTNYEILQLLQNVAINKICNAYPDVMKENVPPIYLPCVDDYSNDPFLPEDEFTLLKKGQFSKIPIMQGVNRDEGLFNLIGLDQKLDSLNNDWESAAQKVFFEYAEETKRPDLIDVVNRIKKFYFNDQQIGEINLMKFAELSADKWFNAPLHLSSLLISANSSQPLYRYIFDHDGKFSVIGLMALPTFKLMSKIIIKKLLNLNVFNDRRPGVNHADDLIYLFRNELGLNSDECPVDQTVSNTMVKLWTSFASSGHPSHSVFEEWLPYSKEKVNEYYHIAEKCEMKVLDEEYMKRMEFWLENVFKGYN